MFDLETYSTVLIALAPALTAIISIIVGVVKMVKEIKKAKQENKDESQKLTDSLKKTVEDIGVIKSRMTEIEKVIVEEKKKRNVR